MLRHCLQCNFFVLFTRTGVLLRRSHGHALDYFLQRSIRAAAPAGPRPASGPAINSAASIAGTSPNSLCPWPLQQPFRKAHIRSCRHRRPRDYSRGRHSPDRRSARRRKLSFAKRSSSPLRTRQIHTIDTVEIRWPSGKLEPWKNVAADAIYVVVEGPGIRDTKPLLPLAASATPSGNH